MSTSLIQYAPELIKKLEEEKKDYPIDPLVLAILNGVKKTRVEAGPSGPAGHHHGNNHRGHRTYAGGPGRGSGDVRHKGVPKYAGNYHEGRGGRGRGSGRGRNSRGPPPNRAPRVPRKKLFEEPKAFSDDRMLSDIRTILGKLSSENVPAITSQLTKLALDKPECIDETSGVLHESAINGVFIVDYYVNIFLEIGKIYPTIIPYLNRRILRQISEPQTFADESDSITETRQQKVERWQTSNALLFAELYKRGVYSDDLLKKVLRLFLEKTNPTTQEGKFPLKIMVEFLPPILPKLVKRMTAPGDQTLDISDIYTKLQEISKDKSYPGLVRFPILTLVKDWADALENARKA